jgi:hypothetical protein
MLIYMCEELMKKANKRIKLAKNIMEKIGHRQELDELFGTGLLPGSRSRTTKPKNENLPTQAADPEFQTAYRASILQGKGISPEEDEARKTGKPYVRQNSAAFSGPGTPDAFDIEDIQSRREAESTKAAGERLARPYQDILHQAAGSKDEQEIAMQRSASLPKPEERGKFSTLSKLAKGIGQTATGLAKATAYYSLAAPNQFNVDQRAMTAQNRLKYGSEAASRYNPRGLTSVSSFLSSPGEGLGYVNKFNPQTGKIEKVRQEEELVGDNARSLETLLRKSHNRLPGASLSALKNRNNPVATMLFGTTDIHDEGRQADDSVRAGTSDISRQIGTSSGGLGYEIFGKGIFNKMGERSDRRFVAKHFGSEPKAGNPAATDGLAQQRAAAGQADREAMRDGLKRMRDERGVDFDKQSETERRLKGVMPFLKGQQRIAVQDRTLANMRRVPVPPQNVTSRSGSVFTPLTPPTATQAARDAAERRLRGLSNSRLVRMSFNQDQTPSVSRELDRRRAQADVLNLGAHRGRY